ncbi:MAG: YceI family protein, partial [Alphaproteobacteria bacterium]|nr:YceI family protein [Alphaproteobacteria bacterium]
DRDETINRMRGFLGDFGVRAIIVLVLGLFALTFFVIATKSEEAESDALEQSQTIERPDPILAEGQAQAVQNEWFIVSDKSQINFTATQNGQAFTGTFPSLRGRIVFNPEKLADSLAEITIDINALKTGSAERDQQAKAEDWFDTARFPVATFKTTSFAPGAADDSYVAQGRLDLRGVSVPVTLPFTLEIDGNTEERIAYMTSHLTLNRQDFGIGQGQWADEKTIGHDVKIDVQVTATDRPPAQPLH